MIEDGPLEFTDIQMARASLILSLRQHGIMEPDILRAFESVPHEAFIPDEYLKYAYRDGSLPIAGGQSITSPIHMAAMFVALDPSGAEKILEIGTGSGYSAALLAKMAKRVFTTERNQALAKVASANWVRASASGIVGFNVDGLPGLSGHQPFDRIVLNGSVTEIPQALQEQLVDGGILVAPVGKPDERQTITRIVRAGSSFVASDHGKIRLAALMSGKSREL